MARWSRGFRATHLGTNLRGHRRKPSWVEAQTFVGAQASNVQAGFRGIIEAQGAGFKMQLDMILLYCL